MSQAVEINEDGLVLGAGTVLARMKSDSFGARFLALDEDRSRIFAPLAAAYGRSPPPDLPVHLESAARFWKRGDKALANIRLAFARLPKLDDAPNDRAGAYRLFLAENLLEIGMPPESLLKIFGFDGPSTEVAKYDPAQPRVPSGSGRASGQWTSTDAAPALSAPKAGPADAGARLLTPAVASPGTLAVGLFGAAGGEFFAGLAALTAAIGTGAALGAIFVTPGKSVVFGGALPGNPNLRYSLNNDRGVLRFFRQTESGSETVAIAHQGRDGIFFEVETGDPSRAQC